VAGFTGRADELARLAVQASGAAVVVTAIGGTAGVSGKHLCVVTHH
jgi:hypothetical protein